MRADGKRGDLFGLDIAAWWQYWRAGWRELLWGRSVGIRRQLEAPVALEDADSGQVHFFLAESPLEKSPLKDDSLKGVSPGEYPLREAPSVRATHHQGTSAQAGRSLLSARIRTAAVQAKTVAQNLLAQSNAGGTVHPALLLPTDQGLVRTLVLPRSLETELEHTIALEVQANSPFLAEDTCHGWTIYKREGDLLHIALVIAAISDVHAHLSHHGHSGAGQVAEDLPEIWYLVPGEVGPVVLRGFGEHRRQSAYRRRLYWLGAAIAYLLVITIAVLAVPGLVRHMQVDNMTGHLAAAQVAAAESMALRDGLATDNQRVLELQKLIDTQLDHHALLDHLAAQAGDDVYLQQLDIDSDRIRLRGWSANAAAFMQLLTQDSRYAEVKAPSGIRRDARAGLEQFVLELHIDREALAVMGAGT